MGRLRGKLIWAVLLSAIVVPLAIAGASPLLAWRSPIYIVAGFAGIIAMALLLVQPLLVAGYVPGLPGRRMHRWIGGCLVATVVVHVLGLWVTSPPDVIDALLFRSPTPFAAWGVLAMWAMFAAAMVAVFRRRMPPKTWRRAHQILAGTIVLGSIVHALRIEGTMGPQSKAVLCAMVLGAAALVLIYPNMRKALSRRIRSKH